MSYHSTIYTNKELRKLLKEYNIINFQLASIQGKPAKIKHKLIINKNKVTIFGSDFIAKGYLI